MQKFDFDGPNKLFIAKAGVTYVDVKVDLYSDYKEELLLSDNTKYLQALRVIGGDQIPGSYIDGTFFLMNGWRIRPDEANHTLVINGNLYTDEGVDPIIPTLGSYNVLVRQVVSNIVNIVSTSGSSPSAIASAVWSDTTGSYLSSSMASISSSNEQVYGAVQEMSSSVSFMSSSVYFLSSSMIGVSASNVEVYNAVSGMSSSVEYMSGSFSFLSSSMIDLSGSNTQVYNAIQVMSSSVDYMSGSVTYLSGAMVEVSASSEQTYNAIQTISGSINNLYHVGNGNWKIDVNTRQMLFYDLNGVILETFDLLDEQGQPSIDRIFERRRVQ